MLLVIVCSPGENPTVDGQVFPLVWEPLSLILPNGSILPLGKELVAIPETGVRVCVLRSSIPGTMTLGFEAPAKVVIGREPPGEIL